ncbi:MAG TPA: YciI family protein [Solirubrobacterales bacterium]|jgi:hypothetical protein|nr:YciI family protein [Solirubrobacterales bacterium]
MVLVKANADSEAGVMPKEHELGSMGAFNKQLAEAGVMKAGEGLHPTSKGVRVRFDGDDTTVIDGPFSETKELLAGFWIWEVDSLEDAVEWLKRAPFREGDVEIRQIFEAEDFGEEFTPELREQEESIRAKVEADQQ